MVARAGKNPHDIFGIRNAIRRILGTTPAYSTAKYSGSLRTLTAPTVGTAAQNAVAIQEINDVLATLIEDQQDKGMLSES